MSKIGQFVALAALATVVASCVGADDYGTEAEAASSGSAVLQLCHTMDGRIRGRGASVWKVRDSEDLLAVDVDGDIVCVDTVEQTLNLGLIAIPPLTEPISCFSFCDGTPIPADKFNAAARDHAGRGRSYWF